MTNPEHPDNQTPQSTLHPLDAEALYGTLLQQIRAGLAGVDDIALVGIHSGGAWLAERLAADLGLAGRLGFVDPSFYRDDYAEKGLRPDVKASQVPFDVNGAAIVLVDDVLYTGRTTRAAINELFDYGRAHLPGRAGRPRRPRAADLRRFPGRHNGVGPATVAATSTGRRRPLFPDGGPCIIHN
jgi:hypothetical protein